MAKIKIRLVLTLEEPKLNEDQIMKAGAGIGKMYEDNDPNMKCVGLVLVEDGEPEEKSKLVVVPASHI